MSAASTLRRDHVITALQSLATGDTRSATGIAWDAAVRTAIEAVAGIPPESSDDAKAEIPAFKARVLAVLRDLPCERFDAPLDVILACIRAVETIK